MALLLTVVVTVCFIASLLPFMLPGAVIGLLAPTVGFFLRQRIGGADAHPPRRARALRPSPGRSAPEPARPLTSHRLAGGDGASRLPSTSKSTPATKKPTVR